MTAASVAATLPELRIPLFARAPVIDGVIQPAEWRDAAAVSGLGQPLEPRMAQAFVGGDRQNLYFAFRTELPPDGKLLSTVRRRGGAVINDDCVELWLVPPTAGRRTDNGPRSQGYFQMLVNSLGTIMDRHLEPGYGLPTQSWNVNAMVASRITADGYWELEIAIPLIEFGLTQSVLPAEWRMRLVRNWKSPAFQAGLPQGGDFSDTKTMMPVIFTADVPAVHLDALGGLQTGRPEFQINLFNPGSAPAVLETVAEAATEGKTIFTSRQTVTVPPGTVQECRLAGEFTPAPETAWNIQVAGTNGGPVLLRHGGVFRPLPEHKWTMPEEFLTFSLAGDRADLKANRSAGRADPVKVTGTPGLAPGTKGQAVQFPDGAAILYESARNLTVPGAVSFWLQVNRDRLPDSSKSGAPYAFSMFWMTDFKPSGYLGIQDSVYGNLNLFVHHFPGIANKNIQGPFPWEKGRWYHVLANFHPQKVELYLDGRMLAQNELERPLKSGELSNFILGSAGPNQEAIDEFQIYSRPLTPDEIRKLALGEAALDGRIAFLPTPNLLVLEALTEVGKLDQAGLRLNVADAMKTVFQTPITPALWETATAGLLRLRQPVKLPDLPEGKYLAMLEENPAADGRPGRVLLRKTFTVKHYAWENNALGKSDTILRPFTPLQVAGNRVSSLLRNHTLGNLGLWEQVEAQGQELLARPISLIAEVQGQRLTWAADPLVVTEAKPAAVTFTGAGRNAALKITSTGRFEYDGLMKLTLTLTPQAGGQLDRLWLEIPVKKEMAPLFHANGEHLRANPGGFVPPGDGVVWGSRSIPQPHVENFIPYIWVGGAERGICWAADWDRGWIHSAARAAVELVREAQAVVIRVNLINGPVTLTAPRTIEFALEATPVKPLPDGWRDQAFDFDSPGRGRFTILWAGSYGAHYGWATRYPLDGDFTFIQKLTEAKNTGMIDQAFIDNWTKRVMTSPAQLSFRDNEATLRSHINSGFNRAQGMYQRQPPGKLIPYSCACEGTGQLPEDEIFGDEWGWFGESMQSSASFRDYAVWYAAKMMENGMGGIYVDNSFLCAKFNWPMGEGYIGDDGKVHPSLGLWRIRDLIRRLAVMMQEKGFEPFVYVHMTNANLVPMLGFAQANLDWEWKYGGSDYQDRFPADYIRAVSTGRQTGTVSVLLGGNAGPEPGSAEDVRLTRTGLAMVLPHQLFFYARVDGKTAITAREIIAEYVSRPEVRSLFYWENRAAVKAPENLLVTVHAASDKILLVIGNTGEAGTFPIELQPAEFKANALAGAVNRETGAAVPLAGTTLQVTLAKHDFALLEVKLQL